MPWTLLALACAEPLPLDSGPLPFDLGEVQSCNSGLDRPRYTETGAARGLEALAHPGLPHDMGGSVVVEDLDRDGDTDLVFSWPEELLLALQNPDRSFTVTRHEGPRDELLLGLADLNHDGDLELLVGGRPARVYELLDGRLRHYRLWDPDALDLPSAQALFPADVDGDGHLDLFALVRAFEQGPSFLLRGDGRGQFTPDLEAIPAELTLRAGFHALWLDPDWDGDPDLYLVNDLGPIYGGNVYLENQGGVLVDATASCGCGLVVAGMGVDAGDFNGDGAVDLLVTATGQTTLLQGLGGASWVDSTAALRVPPPGEAWRMEWGAMSLDHDNDGLGDWWVATGDQWSDPEQGVVEDRAPQLLVFTGEQVEDRAAAYGLNVPGSWRSVAAWDDNHDGVLDLLITDVEDRPRLFESTACTSAGWLEVQAPEGSEVVLEAGGRRWRARVDRGQGLGGAGPSVVHLGLGEAQEVDWLQVRTPAGELLEGGPFPARRRVVVPDAQVVAAGR